MKRAVYALMTLMLLGGSLPALASTIDFTNGSCSGLAVCSKTLSDNSATATFANVLAEGSGPYTFFNLSNGLALGSGGLGYTWTVTFDNTVTLSGVDIGFSSNHLGFNINGAGVTATSLLAGVASNSSHLIGPFTFLGGETYVFASNNICPSCGGITFKSWGFSTVSSNVPAPAAFSLLAIGLLGLGLRRAA